MTAGGGAPDQAGAMLAARLAGTLPEADVLDLAAAASRGQSGLQNLRNRVTSQVMRNACDQLAEEVQSSSPAHLGGALLGAAHAVRIQRSRQTVDIVWTGPSSTVTTSRLTSAVANDLIDSAQQEIMLVSFATHGQQIRSSLDRAVARGVNITLLLERPADNPRYTGASDPFPGLVARRLTWPADHRPPGAAVHAKLIVVDGTAALVGSANLTGHAMDHNLECGVLIRGGRQPAEIRDHLRALLEQGSFRSDA